MKKEHWKYLSLSLSIISTIFLVYSVVLPAVTGINMTEHSIQPINTNDLSVEDIFINPSSNMALSITPIGVALTSIGLDQVQDEVTGAVYISSSYWWGQGVALGEYKNINGYQLAVGKHGNPTHPLHLGITASSGIVTFERVIEVPASALPDEDTLYFVGSTFEDNPYYENYPVLACASDDDQTDGNYWMLGYSENNPCPGTCRMTSYNFDTGHWVVLGGTENWDAAFAIYTEEAGGGGGGEPPVISISINTYIQTAGLIALLGAVLSGTKYGTVVGWF